MEWLSLCSLIFTTIFTLSLLIDLYYPSEWSTKSAVITYSLSKIISYNFFLERLFFIFNHARENKIDVFRLCKVVMLRIFTVIWPFLFSIIFIIAGSNTYPANSGETYVESVSIVDGLIMMIGDLCVNLTISILFSRRLLFLIESQNRNRYKIKYTLLKRCLILNIIAIISTQLTFIAIVCFGLVPMFASLDVAISSWCMLLSFTHYDTIYRVTFGAVHNWIGLRCLLCYTCYCCYCCRLQSVQNRDVARTNIEEKSTEIAEIQEIFNYITLTSADIGCGANN